MISGTFLCIRDVKDGGPSGRLQVAKMKSVRTRSKTILLIAALIDIWNT